jgi:hypothetical protein
VEIILYNGNDTHLLSGFFSPSFLPGKSKIFRTLLLILLLTNQSSFCLQVKDGETGQQLENEEEAGFFGTHSMLAQQ